MGAVNEHVRSKLLDFLFFDLYTEAMSARSFLALLILPFGLAAHCESAETKSPRLIIRCDDIGFCHGVNMAFKRVAEAGMVSSVSVIVNTPWLDEAVEILKQHPEISVGIHLT